MIATAEEFVALRTSDNRGEYTRAAEEPAPLAVWLEVIERYPDMRTWVAHNKTVPVEILEVLARDPDPAVRWTVAKKRKLTVQLFELMASDEDETVRLRIALNRNVPRHVLEHLIDDDWEAVRKAAAERLSAMA